MLLGSLSRPDALRIPAEYLPQDLCRHSQNICLAVSCRPCDVLLVVESSSSLKPAREPRSPTTKGCTVTLQHDFLSGNVRCQRLILFSLFLLSGTSIFRTIFFILFSTTMAGRHSEILASVGMDKSTLIFSFSMSITPTPFHPVVLIWSSGGILNWNFLLSARITRYTTLSCRSLYTVHLRGGHADSKWPIVSFAAPQRLQLIGPVLCSMKRW